MNRKRPPTASHRPSGFTMLELIMAMAVFSILGAAVVVLMRQGMSIFSAATRDVALQDRMDTIFPQIERDMHLLALPARFDESPAPPTEEERQGGVEWVPPPPVEVRVRAGGILLTDEENPRLKRRCTYFAFVIDISGNRSDRLLRRAGEVTGPEPVEIVPKTETVENDLTILKPSGGLREVCYVAVPENPAYPALLTVWRGWRSPVGGEGTLLDPKNLDSMNKIKERCRRIETGVLLLDATWRRVFATSWDLSPPGATAEHDPYVGRKWDSTRALDKKFPLFVGPHSLGNPSDDIFPAWARIQISLIAPGPRGFERGVTFLRDSVADDGKTILVDDAELLLGPGEAVRWLKIDGEWMRYRPAKINLAMNRVPVERGLRGTEAMGHDANAEVYVGLESSRDIRLLFRDGFAKTNSTGRR